jgi:hypothetical protein
MQSIDARFAARFSFPVRNSWTLQNSFEFLDRRVFDDSINLR